MSRKIKITLILLILSIAIFNKKIVSYYYLNKLSNWVERPLKTSKLDFTYSGNVEIKGLKIFNSEEDFYKYIFKAERIKLIFDTKSLFTNLVIVKKISILNPEFFLNIKINKDENKNNISYEDNIGLAKKLNENIPDKIWPKKNKDINFLILESEILGAEGNIKISSINEPETIKLSSMKFSSFGNDKNFRHYKDVLKSILYDLYARAKKQNLKQTIKKIYKF